jgi:3-methylcrotonyl-CoA carboxylase alpha subunit
MARRLTLRGGDRTATVDVSDGAVTVEGSDMSVTGEAPGVVRVDGRKAWVAAAGDTRWVYYDGRVHVLEVQRSDAPRRQRRQQESLAAPMPATVRQIRVTPGDQVARGDTLIVLEAMKMELPVRANEHGTVAAVHCREGELVQPGRPLVDITPDTERL